VSRPQFDVWEREAWAPPPELTIDRWAEETICLPRANAEMSGDLSWDVAPFAREILQAATDPDVEEITLCFSAQTCKTLIGVCIMLYFLAQDPWPCLHVMAREADAIALNEERYQSIILSSPKLAALLSGAAHDMTREAIRLRGMALNFASANSPAALATRSICKLALDETDKYEEFSGREASPIALARERTITFTSRLILKMSTPTTERGYIWREFLQGDRRRYWVPCPLCGFFQLLIMGTPGDGTPGIKIPAGERDPERIIDKRLAWYECEACHGRISDQDKAAMLRGGKWVPEAQTINRRTGVVSGAAPSRRRLSYHISRLYAPWGNSSFSHVIAELLRSKGSAQDLMNFRNSWLAEVWEDKVEEVTAAHVRSRVGGYEAGTVPLEAHCLTAGVDVQLDHLWYVIRAWGAHGESWLVREGRVEGWEALNKVLFQAHYMAGADPVPVKCVLIDMGYRTDEVFSFARRTGCQPVKGAANPSRCFTVTKHQHADGSVSPLVLIDTGYYKAKLHRLIRIRDEDPGAWHLPGVVGADGLTTDGVDEEYYAHIVSEQRVREQEKKTGRVHFPWKRIPAGAANHLLDCEVYALAAAEILDVEHCYTIPPVRSGLGTSAVLVNPTANVVKPPPKRPRFQKIKTRFFS
jgi:phage terminase large subunit GpA-like protein